MVRTRRDDRQAQAKIDNNKKAVSIANVLK